MHLHHISEFLNFQDIHVESFTVDDADLQIEIIIEPINWRQTCPLCLKDDDVISKGRRKTKRRVRHLNLFHYETFLLLPSLILMCKACHLKFTYRYSFVDNGKHQTYHIQGEAAHLLKGSTVKVVAEEFGLPYSTCERMVKETLSQEVSTMQKEVFEQAVSNQNLVLGLDDFSTRKGHRYNTGIHDLKSGMLLIIVKGRGYHRLIQQAELTEQLRLLKPVAVVMDLAPGYHRFVKEIWPEAVRIADRFHVNSYVTDALKSIRIRVTKELRIKSRTSSELLRKNKHLLSRRCDDLDERQKSILHKILTLSSDIEAAYRLKEDLIDWFDLSDANNSYHKLMAWINRGESLNIPEITDALKTFRNWSQEISNYHKYRFTNASVEGKNNRIKELQRRCFYLRNEAVYKERTYQECNLENWKFSED